MAFQVSPGIATSELDFTAGTQQVSVSDAAFAGPFVWGPALDPQNIGSVDDLVKRFGKPDDVVAPYWFSAQSFLAYSNLLHCVRAIGAGALNSTPTAKALLGTVTATGNSTTWTGGGGFVTGFGTTTPTIVAGQRLSIGSVIYTVNAVTNSSSFTTTAAPAANVAANTIAAFGVLIKNAGAYDLTFSLGIVGYGPFSAKWAGELGNSLKYSVCSSTNAFAQGTLTGSISLTSGSNTVTGTGTAFSTELIVGDFLTFNGVSYSVTAIANTTQLSLATTAQVTATVASGSWGRKWEFNSLFDRAPGTSNYVSTRGGSADELHLVVVDVAGQHTGVPGTVLERFAFLSKANNAKNANGENNYYVEAVNRQSAYLWWLDIPATNQTNWGKDSTFAFGADTLPLTATLVGGQTDNANLNDSGLQTAYDQFKNKDVIDISLVITGPATAALASYVIQNICESRGDCVAFVSPLKNNVVNNVGGEVAAITSFRNSLPSSSYGFLDSGWKYAYDKYNDKFRWVPLNGDIAGIAARSDSQNDPWFSPAGFTRGNVKNVVKLAWNPKQLDRDDLYKINVNSVVSFPGQGVTLYGDKTLLDRPSAFDRINVRRLFIVLEKTISRLAQAQLFEFNDEFTRSQFRNIVEPYLRDVKSRRGVVDYRVVCDESNNTTTVVEQNKFVGDIFVKPARSINFIQLNFSAVRSGVSFQELVGTGN
jgi:phage tail sheath protein FI